MVVRYRLQTRTCDLLITFLSNLLLTFLSQPANHVLAPSPSPLITFLSHSTNPTQFRYGELYAWPTAISLPPQIRFLVFFAFARAPSIFHQLFLFFFPPSNPFHIMVLATSCNLWYNFSLIYIF